MNNHQIAFLAAVYIACGIVAYKTRGIDYADSFMTGLVAFIFTVATIGLILFGFSFFFSFLGQF